MQDVMKVQNPVNSEVSTMLGKMKRDSPVVAQYNHCRLLVKNANIPFFVRGKGKNAAPSFSLLVTVNYFQALH